MDEAVVGGNCRTVAQASVRAMKDLCEYDAAAAPSFPLQILRLVPEALLTSGRR